MTCKDCPVELPKSTKPNISGRCFKCRRIAAKSSNSPETRAFQASYRAEHREERNAEKKAWYQATKRSNLQPMLVEEHLKKSTEDRKWKI